MADYKHRANKNKRKTNTSCSLWFFGGFVAGAFIIGLLWLKLGPEIASGQVPGIKRPSPVVKSNNKDKPKPRFDFYTILPEMEVIVPDEEIVPPEPAATNNTSTPSFRRDDGSKYILQMGSFRKYEDADRMKAKLALIGIEAKIQKVSINNRETYHRVRSGPFTTRQMNAARQLARDNNITSLVIKLKDRG